MKKILLLITAMLVLFACKKKSTQGTLWIDTEHISVEGSFVQGTVNSNLCKAVIPYSNSNGGTAEIVADEVNGVKIEKQNITLNNGTGEIKVNIAGTPLQLQPTFLQVQIKYGGKTYITSVEIPIASDPNPNGTVTFTIDNIPITGLTSAVTLPFTVDPTMTAVVSTATVQGLTVTVNTNSTTGQGFVTLTPSTTFMGGTVQLTAQFGARPTQVVNIPVSYFANGEGTASNPFEVTDAVSLAKIQYGTATQYFKVINDFDAGTWTPISSFNTNLDGNGKTITYTTNTPAADSVALIKKINGGSISNLTLAGTATGKNYVAGLATWSAVAISGVTSTVNVTGTNNVANLIASGSGKDASTLVVGALPTAINIVAPATTGFVLLNIAPANGIAYSEVLNATDATLSYNTSDGKITATLPGSGFTAGDVTYYMSLTSATNVRTSDLTIALSSKSMYESGTGIADDPYMVADADQLYQTMINFPNSYIKVKNDITVTSWTTVTTFSGNLDGDGHKVSGLNNPMIATLNGGTIQNIKLVGVVIIGTGTLGVIANTSTGTATFDKIAVVGSLGNTSTGDNPTGGIVGEMGAGTISDCYVNITMPITVGIGSGIVGRIGNTAGTENVTISNCTSEGTITVTGAQSKFAGILARRGNANTTATYIIKNCLSSMVITAATSGANMAAGIFGANQGTTGISIDQCMFTGRIYIDQTGGGIAGASCNISNCIVVGQGAATTNSTIYANSGTAGNGAGGIATAVKGNIDKCIVANARITGGTYSNRGAGGICSDYNGGTLPTITNNVVMNSSVTTTTGRTIIGTQNVTVNASFGNIANNYYYNITYSDGTAYNPAAVTDDVKINGTAYTATPTQADFTTLGYDFTNIWDWDAINNRPKLRNVGCASSVIP